MARVAHAMAMENPRIRGDVVEVQEFPQLAQRYAVRGVPKTVINGTTEFLGAVPEEAFLGMVLKAIGKDDSQKQEEEGNQPAP